MKKPNLFFLFKDPLPIINTIILFLYEVTCVQEPNRLQQLQ